MIRSYRGLDSSLHISETRDSRNNIENRAVKYMKYGDTNFIRDNRVLFINMELPISDLSDKYFQIKYI